MYTLDTSFGVVKIRFRHIRDHRDLREIPTGLNLFRVVRAVEAEVMFNGRVNYGQAFCSWMDLFNPDKGKVKALREAFAEANFSRPERLSCGASSLQPALIGRRRSSSSRVGRSWRS